MASPYIQFPKKLLQCSYISAQAKILYCVLYDLQRAKRAEGGMSRPTPSTEGVEVKQKTLALKLGVSDRWIRKILQELKDEKLVSVERWGNDIARYYITPPDDIKTDTERELEKKLAKK